MRGFKEFVSRAIVALNAVRFFGSDSNEKVQDKERVREKMGENEREEHTFAYACGGYL